MCVRFRYAVSAWAVGRKQGLSPSLETDTRFMKYTVHNWFYVSDPVYKSQRVHLFLTSSVLCESCLVYGLHSFVSSFDSGCLVVGDSWIHRSLESVSLNLDFCTVTDKSPDVRSSSVCVHFELYSLHTYVCSILSCLFLLVKSDPSVPSGESSYWSTRHFSYCKVIPQFSFRPVSRERPLTFHKRCHL